MPSQATNPLADALDDREGAIARDWWRRLPWYRRFTARLGLQGKLILSFMLMLTVGLGSSCWIYTAQSDTRIWDTTGEQAKQIAYALSLAGKPGIERGQPDELARIGHDLLKTRNVLFVAFFDARYRPISFAHRDPDVRSANFIEMGGSVTSLMQVRAASSPLFGDYVQVCAPVLSVVTPAELAAAAKAGGGGGGGPAAAPRRAPPAPAGTRLLGYVTVGLSQSAEQAQLRRVNVFVALIGGAIVLCALPLAAALVHRIFYPIRQLVDATNRIIEGDLDACVAIHRPDAIGTLARAFNAMVKRVKEQQLALEAANKQLEAANRDLERKVSQRTAALETANKRLSSEIAEKEDFLRAVSHDLNAPLRNISGMASMLLMKHRDTLDQEVVHRLERIQKNVEVETDLIGELLELSRIKTRRQKMEAVDVAALVRELGELFENDLKTHRIALVIDTPLPTLQGERARLRQVFQNLIDNAIKYMGEGPTREIHIGCAVRPSEAEFYVCDTGLGIDPEDVGKVFFVFRRGKNLSARNVSGKGVGLASVKSIVETYNGSIWVESAPGRGSTFRFTINGRFVGTAREQGGTVPPVAA